MSETARNDARIKELTASVATGNLTAEQKTAAEAEIAKLKAANEKLAR